MHPYFAIRATEEHRRDLEAAADRRRRAQPAAAPKRLARPAQLRAQLGLAVVAVGLRVAGPLRVPADTGRCTGSTL